MKQTMSRPILSGWFALIAMLLSLDASAQPTPQPFWNVDIGVAGTFTPVGGSDPVGIGPAISVAITKDTFRGEKDSNGGGFVGMLAGVRETCGRMSGSSHFKPSAA
jgi:hypothetical protein